MNKYKSISKRGEGTFSEVIKATVIGTGKMVAIKRMKDTFDSIEKVNNLREIQALKRLSPHPHIVKLLEVIYDKPTGRLGLVFELMECNIYELIKNRKTYLSEQKVKKYMWQMFKSVDHMHRNGIFHRDIKPENLLIQDDTLKLADFGSCRGIKSKAPFTEYISTRWYRAPECLLTDGYYNYKMDLWGAGCVMYEVITLYPLFPGQTEIDQLQKIHGILGTPPPEYLAKLRKFASHIANYNFAPKTGSGLEKVIPAHVSNPAELVDLLKHLLAYNPDDRYTARQALKHPYFKDLREAEQKMKTMQGADGTDSSTPRESKEDASLIASMDKLAVDNNKTPRLTKESTYPFTNSNGLVATMPAPLPAAPSAIPLGPPPRQISITDFNSQLFNGGKDKTKLNNPGKQEVIQQPPVVQPAKMRQSQTLPSLGPFLNNNGVSNNPTNPKGVLSSSQQDMGLLLPSIQKQANAPKPFGR